MIIGVISDTHGLLRPEALAALRGSERIIHAGDVGGPEILDALVAVAPVTVVRGNNDRGPWAEAIPTTAVVEVAGVSIYILHNIADIMAEIDLDPAACGFGVVVAGHSHKPLCETRGQVLYFNPGSAGPRRFRLPVSVGRLTIEVGVVHGEILILDSGQYDLDQGRRPTKSIW
jgi:putative phosphoesterase